MLALALALSTAAAPPLAQDARTLLDDCRAALIEPRLVTEEAHARGAHCLGYVAGVADAHALIVGLTPTARLWCEPDAGMTAQERARIVVSYLEKNPKRQEAAARTEVILAMKRAFPCKASHEGDPFADVPEMDLPPGSRLVPAHPTAPGRDL